MNEVGAPGVIDVAEGLDKHQLASIKNVSPRTVVRWRERGLPALEKRGHNGCLLFDIEMTDNWLAAEGIVPGYHGTEGGAARRDGPAGDPEPFFLEIDSDDAVGLAATVRRMRQMEQAIHERICNAAEGDSALKLQGEMKSWLDLVDKLRKAEKSLLDLEEQRGRLISRNDFQDSVCALAAVFRASLERFPEEVSPRIVSSLAKQGIELGDMGAMQRALHQSLREVSDGWLETLSREVASHISGSAENGSSD